MARTVHDWLKSASLATGAREADRAFEQAVASADSCHDWRAILRAVTASCLASRERIAAAASRTLAAATAEHDVWGFRDVAAAFATRLDDGHGARAALDRGLKSLLERKGDEGDAGQPAWLASSPTRGYEWEILAAGYAETLADEAGRRRCLEAGIEGARRASNADDLCAVAEAWGRSVGRERGLALLHEAEATAANGSARPWTLANAWSRLGDVESVRRVLDRAQHEARSLDDTLHVAKAWACHRRPQDTLRALARARALATTSDDWLRIAETAFDSAAGDDVVRDALARAEVLATDDEARGRVSSGYRLWLRDEVSAARVGPRGVRPGRLRRPAATRLSGWDASASDLFDGLRACATVESLRRIAGADHGNDAEQHLLALRDLCDTGLVPSRLAWVPGEVVALTRWSQGEEVDHVARALCCTLRCLVPDGAGLVVDGVILTDSCLALGRETGASAERFFAWLGSSVPVGDMTDADASDRDRPIALLLLFLVRAAHAVDDERLPALARAVVSASACAPEPVSEQIAGSMRRALWEELVRRVLEPMRQAHPFVADVLAVLGR